MNLYFEKTDWCVKILIGFNNIKNLLGGTLTCV
jgi:hypothetical protein